MTKSLTNTQVRELRDANFNKVFNMTLALEAMENTPAKSGGARATGAFTENILALFKAKGGALAVNQVVAGLTAGGFETTSKKVSDRLWLLAKNGTLKKGESKGMYELA